jgi:hypothetical protein
LPPDRLTEFAGVAAYQRMRLVELRTLYDRLDLDLEHYLDLESRVGTESLLLEQTEFASLRRFFSEQGIDVRLPKYDAAPSVTSEGTLGERYQKVGTGRVKDYDELVTLADAYLRNAGVDLGQDPLLQVLSTQEASSVTDSYKRTYGDTSWDRSDYLVIMLAGFVATLLDIFLVRIPADTRFLGELQQGSPLTKWLKKNSEPVHEHFLSRFEDAAKVPYDDSVGKLVDGLSPKVHRLMSPGHDPVLGFIFGTMDIIKSTGTFIDKHGELKTIGKLANPEGLTIAFLKVFLHLLSDVCTSAGVPPPFLTLLQLVKAKSPFVLGPSGEKVSWTNVARYMYTHGYDLRHFATMGLVPATVEMTIRGWWLLQGFERSREDAEPAKAKLASMLMLGHTIATSGSLLKTGIVFGMNPLALNWAQMLAMFPVTVSWVRESVKRDRSIRRALDAQWSDVYDEATSNRPW